MRAPGSVRIIGGQWKRSLLPVVESSGLRPTPDRIRETLFNWLGQDLTGWRVIDLFAGTGALGFEAASRGAARVVMIEAARPVAAALRAGQDRLAAAAIELVVGDALAHAQRLAQCEPNSFDLAFLDPPYRAGWHARMIGLVPRLLAPDGLLYTEAEQALQRLDGFDLPDSLEIVRQAKAGQVHYYLLRHTAPGVLR